MAYQKLNWLNKGETGAIPINKTNLNHMDDGIVESNVFRNLFNVGDAIISTNTGLNFNKTNNQILINGSSTKETDIFLDSPSGNKDKEGIILKAGTYTATIKKVSGSLANNPISFYLKKSNGTSIYNGTNIFVQNIEVGISDGTAYSATFTLTEETRLHWLGYFGNDLRTFNNLILEFQIEESPTPTSYTPWAGYIVESGSNDNSSWIKYSDGTLIQYGSIQKNISITALSSSGKYYYQDDISLTLPIIFANDSYYSNVIPVNNQNGSQNVYSVRNKTQSKFDFCLSSLTSYSSNINVFWWFAIGKWK